MPRQHEPPANGTAPSVAVRRAVAVPAPGEDPGADLGPRTPGAVAPVPIPSFPEPASRRLRGWRARSAAAEQQEQASAEQQQEQQEREQQQARQQQESASAEPEAEASVGVFLTGNGGDANGADGAEPAEAPPGRPRGPMLAAAGIAGALLIAVPFLVLALSDDDGDRTVSTAPIGGTTLDPDMSDDDPAADYVAESPSPSVSPTGSPSPSKSVSSGSGAEGVEVKAAPQPVVTKETAAPKAKATKAAAPTARELANALSNRANVLLKNVATNRCADLPGSGKGKSGGSVNQHLSCSATDNQLWDLKVTDSDGGPEGSSLFVIKNRTDGLCMDLPYYTNVAPETRITEHACDGSNADNQLYWLDPRPQGYWIRNVASNLCISVTGGRSAKDNAGLQVVKCGDTSVSAERWIVSQVVKP